MSAPVHLRPTTVSMMDSMTSGLENDQRVISQLQTQISSGRRINQPSDDPAGAVNALALTAANAQAQQYVSNAGDALSYLGTVNSTLNSVLNQLQSVRSNVLSAVSGTNDQSGLNAVAQQVLSAQQALVRSANTTYLNQPIFGGTANIQYAFDPTTGQWNGGASAKAPSRVVGPGQSVAVSVTGDAVFGTGPMSNNPTLNASDSSLTNYNGATDDPGGLLTNDTTSNPPKLGILAQTAADLQSGNVAAARQDLNYIDAAIARVTVQAGVAGAAYNQAQTAQTQAQATSTSLAQQISSVVDVDIISATTALQQDQTTYQAALWATSKVIQPSLVSYLS